MPFTWIDTLIDENALIIGCEQRLDRQREALLEQTERGQATAEAAWLVGHYRRSPILMRTARNTRLAETTLSP